MGCCYSTRQEDKNISTAIVQEKQEQCRMQGYMPSKKEQRWREAEDRDKSGRGTDRQVGIYTSRAAGKQDNLYCSMSSACKNIIMK